jgi:hypothetical protein
MKPLKALISGAPVALAAIVRHPAGQGTQVNVVLQLHKGSSESSVAVQNADRSEVLQYGCGTSLSLGAFQAYPLAFNVNENGAGNIIIGSDTYLIHEDPNVSGGISCGRLHSSTETMVTCAVTLPTSMRLKPLKEHNLPQCFHSSGTFRLASILAALERGASEQPTAGNLTAPPLQGHHSGLDKRQGPCSNWTPGTIMVGDGDPYQNPFNIQLSVCSAGTPFTTSLHVLTNSTRKTCNATPNAPAQSNTAKPNPTPSASPPAPPSRNGSAAGSPWNNSSRQGTTTSARATRAISCVCGRRSGRRRTPCRTCCTMPARATRPVVGLFCCGRLMRMGWGAGFIVFMGGGIVGIRGRGGWIRLGRLGGLEAADQN